MKNQFDLVIASSGGYPKDINFIQAHKSIHHASAFVKNKGILIMLSECRDGIGNDSFLKFFKQKDDTKTLFEKLTNNYDGNGGTALSLKEKTERINIYIFTKLSKEICTQIGVKKINLRQIQDFLEKEKGTIGVINNSSILIK